MAGLMTWVSASIRLGFLGEVLKPITVMPEHERLPKPGDHRSWPTTRRVSNQNSFSVGPVS